MCCSTEAHAVRHCLQRCLACCTVPACRHQCNVSSRGYPMVIYCTNDLADIEGFDKAPLRDRADEQTALAFRLLAFQSHNCSAPEVLSRSPSTEWMYWSAAGPTAGSSEASVKRAGAFKRSGPLLASAAIVSRWQPGADSRTSSDSTAAICCALAALSRSSCTAASVPWHGAS